MIRATMLVHETEAYLSGYEASVAEMITDLITETEEFLAS